MKVLYLPAEELAGEIARYAMTGELDRELDKIGVTNRDLHDYYNSLQMNACAGDTWFELPQEDDEVKKID